MVGTAGLFELIKKLSKAEKRYFTLSARFQEGAKSYMVLFRETEKLEVYDEAILKKNLEVQGFNVAHLAVAKVHLTKLILKSLRSFYEGSSPEQGIMAMLAESDILKSKGLYFQAMKLLEKAKTAARYHELHYHIFEILNRQASMSLDIVDRGINEKLNHLFDEIEELKKTVQTETELRVLLNKMMLLLQTKPLKHPNTLAIIDEIAKNERLRTIDEKDSFFAKIYFLFTNGTVRHAVGNYTDANPYYLTMLELWERYPHLCQSHKRLYKSHISNYLNSCHTLGRYEPFDHWLAKFNAISDTTFDEEAGSFKDFYHIKLLYLLNTGQFSQALGMVKDIERGLKVYKTKIAMSRETIMRFNVFITLFFNERFSDALDWLGTMALDDKIDSKADVRSLSRIMRVIVHYELGHTQILDSLRNSVYRNLKKQEQLHEFERTILDHFKQLEQVVDKKAQKKLWQNLLDKLNKLGETYGWNKIAGLDEITCWAESRLYQKPYVQVFAEKKR